MCSRSCTRADGLGGEGSGHLLALDQHTTGDGIVSALLVLQAVRRSGLPLAQLLEGVDLYPQTLINVRLRPDQTGATTPAGRNRRPRSRDELGRSGRILIRPSGTEPLLRVMVEARDAGQALNGAERMAAAHCALD